MAEDELKMTYSCFLKDQDNKRIVRVRFERGAGAARAFAEGILPGGKIASNKGFSEEECTQLSAYLVQNEADIMERARAISNPMRWL